jgi:hypothetical protein
VCIPSTFAHFQLQSNMGAMPDRRDGASQCKFKMSTPDDESSILDAAIRPQASLVLCEQHSHTSPC